MAQPIPCDRDPEHPPAAVLITYLEKGMAFSLCEACFMAMCEEMAAPDEAQPPTSESDSDEVEAAGDDDGPESRQDEAETTSEASGDTGEPDESDSGADGAPSDAERAAV